jgi:hypothetical protein
VTAVALMVVKALADDEFSGIFDGDGDGDDGDADWGGGALAAASEEVQRAASRVDVLLRAEIEEEAEADGDYLDDDELAALIRGPRWRYWLGRLSPSEALEALEYRLGLLVEAVREYRGFADMVVERQPDLRVPVERACTRVGDEFEAILTRLERAAQ